MLDRVRTSLHRVITTPIGDGFFPIRLQKDLARRVNMAFGEPLCSADELARRRRGHEQLAALGARGAAGRTEAKSVDPVGEGLVDQAPAPEPAPVMVYFEKDRNTRLLGRIEETLSSRNIAFRKLDVSGDETTMHYVMREARCKEDELPIVFIAATPVGGFNELIEWDVSGKLVEAVFGSAAIARA